MACSGGAAENSATRNAAPEPPKPEADEPRQRSPMLPPVPELAGDDTGGNERIPAEDELGPRLGQFQLTYYWMAEIRDKGQGTVPLHHFKTCKPIAKVSESFARRLKIEGTGKLRDGRVVNIAGACKCPSSPCYFVVSKSKRWGVGVGKKPLSPFRTVAVDPNTIKIGTALYVEELDGLTMPGRKPWGGFVHDGCVVAGDRGGGVQGKQLDFFTARRNHYRALFRRHRLQSVTVYDGKGRCDDDDRTVASAERNSI